jgi:hypothetical protein
LKKHAATMIAPFGTMPDPVTGCNGYAKFGRLSIWENKMREESGLDYYHEITGRM